MAFAPLTVGGATLDPLDEDSANRLLIPAGWLYVAGLGPGGHPLFVFGEIVERRRLDDGGELFVLGRELAHALVAVPAMCRPGRIVARRAAVRIHLWTTLEEAAGAHAGRWEDAAELRRLAAGRLELKLTSLFRLFDGDPPHAEAARRAEEFERELTAGA